MADRRKQILARLKSLRRLIDASESRTRALYDEREALFVEGRDMDPPMVQRVMAESSGITEAAVIHVVGRFNRRAAEGVNGG